MKSINVRDAKDKLSDCIRTSQGDSVVILRHGRPVAVLLGVEGKDFESVYWAMNEDLLRQIAASRKRNKTLPHAEVARMFGADARAPRRVRARRSRRAS